MRAVPGWTPWVVVAGLWAMVGLALLVDSWHQHRHGGSQGDPITPVGPRERPEPSSSVQEQVFRHLPSEVQVHGAWVVQEGQESAQNPAQTPDQDPVAPHAKPGPQEKPQTSTEGDAHR